MPLKRICAIDLGSDTIKVTDRNEKLYVCEKNMIAIRNQREIVALGNSAWEIFEKAPADVYAGCPVKDGALAEGRNQELILVYVLKKFATLFTRHPNVYIAAPSDISQVERRAYYKIFGGGLGAKKIRFVQKAVAEAAGIGMPLDDPTGRMVVNLGAGRTEIAVLSEGKVILDRVLQTGGKHLDEAIVSMVRKQYQLHIGSRTARLLKESLARMGETPQGSMRVFGIHAVTGLPKEEEISALSVSVSMIESIDHLAELLLGILERTPPQLLEDIRRTGIYLTGGVSMLPGLSLYLQQELDVPVFNVLEPVSCAVRGLVYIMNDPKLRKTLTFSLREFAEDVTVQPC